jgi:gluconate 5-dehydrogenase
MPQSYHDDWIMLDANNPTEAEEKLRIVESNNQIDILINNAHPMKREAGFNVDTDQIEHYSRAEWQQNINGAIGLPALTTSIIGAGMKARGHGSIINVASMYALVAPHPNLYKDTPYMNPPGYGASKAALLEFTRYVASFWGQYGVRCNALCLGPFPKSITQEMQEFATRLNSRTCLNRTGRAEEIAGAILFLASEASSYMTGHALALDAGWCVT